MEYIHEYKNNITTVNILKYKIKELHKEVIIINEDLLSKLINKYHDKKNTDKLLSNYILSIEKNYFTELLEKRSIEQTSKNKIKHDQGWFDTLDFDFLYPYNTVNCILPIFDKSLDKYTSSPIIVAWKFLLLIYFKSNMSINCKTYPIELELSTKEYMDKWFFIKRLSKAD